MGNPTPHFGLSFQQASTLPSLSSVALNKYEMPNTNSVLVRANTVRPACFSILDRSTKPKRAKKSMVRLLIAKSAL